MADKTEHHDGNDVNDAPEAKDDADAGSTTEKEGFDSPLAFLAAELERAEGEKAALNDRVLRGVAEMENLRRRTQKDVADARQYSIAGFAREMLAVGDNLRRALEAIPEETRESADAGLAALIEGVELTEKTLLQALEKNGVRAIRPQGERFDPHFHQAMFEVADASTPSNTVVQVVQDGFVIGERVLRPAMVGVSKGGPKQPTKPDGDEETVAAADKPDDVSPA